MDICGQVDMDGVTARSGRTRSKEAEGEAVQARRYVDRRSETVDRRQEEGVRENGLEENAPSRVVQSRARGGDGGSKGDYWTGR